MRRVSGRQSRGKAGSESKKLAKCLREGTKCQMVDFMDCHMDCWRHGQPREVVIRLQDWREAIGSYLRTAVALAVSYARPKVAATIL